MLFLFLSLSLFSSPLQLCLITVYRTASADHLLSNLFVITQLIHIVVLFRTPDVESIPFLRLRHDCIWPGVPVPLGMYLLVSIISIAAAVTNSSQFLHVYILYFSKFLVKYALPAFVNRPN